MNAPGSSASQRPIRLLVVDDHVLFRRGLRALLASEPGLDVVGEAGDATEALKRAASLAPDVILLDHHLPGVTGVDVIESLLVAAPRCRILMLTINEDGETLARALQRGAHGYLLKTVDSDVLFDAIRKTITGQPIVSPEMTGKLVSAYQALHAAPAATALPGTAPPATTSVPLRPPGAAAATAATAATGSTTPTEATPRTSLTTAATTGMAEATAATAAPATGALMTGARATTPATATPRALTAASRSTDPLAALSPREHEILREIAAGASNKEIARTLAIAETTVKIHVQHILRKLNLSSRVQAAVLYAGRDGG